MIDIETLGTKSNSVIVSIGAVKFDLETGQTGDTYYVNIDLQSSLDAGLSIDAGTLMWWMKQSDDTRYRLIEDQAKPLYNALSDLSIFIDEDSQVWGNSARFDLGLLQDAYNKIKRPIPWKFRNERCVRTLVSFAPEVKENTKFEGTAHDALDDCYHQIKYCSAIYNKLKI